MPNPVYIPVIFLLGIIFGLFLKKSRNLTVLLLFLIFLFSGLFPLLGFWKTFFHHCSPATSNYLGGILPLILDGHRSLLLGIINLSGLFSGFFLLNFLQNKPTVKLVQYLLFFLSVNLLVISGSVPVAVFAVLGALFSFFGLIYRNFGQKEKQKLLILFLSVSALLITGMLILNFSKSPLDFSAISDSSNFFFFAGLLILFGVFPLTVPINKGLSTEKGIFILLFQGLFLSAVSYVFYLLSQSVSNPSILNAFAIIGLLTYFSASFMATGSVSAVKILSYNTVGQLGLMVSIIGLSRYLGMDNFFILAGIFVTHFFAKTGILWIAADMGEDKITKWTVLQKKTTSLFFFGIFVFALIGFPPFPSFFARWKLFAHLVDYKMYDWIIFYGLSFLLEAYYLLRWVVGISKKEKNPHFIQISSAGWLSASFSLIFLIIASNFSLFYLNNASDLQLFILVSIFLLFLLSFLPPIVQFIFSLGVLFNLSFLMEFSLQDVRLIPIGIIAIFAVLLLISNLRKYKHQSGLNAIVLLMAWSAIIPIVATKWMTVILWAFLFVAGIFLFALHKEKLKGKALFFILLSVTGLIIVTVGLQTIINIAGTTNISAFSWGNMMTISKILIILGSILFIFAFLFIAFANLGHKSNVAHGYFSFRNILAESIDILLSSQIFFWMIQLLLAIGIFGFLMFR